MAANLRPNVLFCMPIRTNYVALVEALRVDSLGLACYVRTDFVHSLNPRP
jgi:hypothetical protein